MYIFLLFVIFSYLEIVVDIPFTPNKHVCLSVCLSAFSSATPLVDMRPLRGWGVSLFLGLHST